MFFGSWYCHSSLSLFPGWLFLLSSRLVTPTSLLTLSFYRQFSGSYPRVFLYYFSACLSLASLCLLYSLHTTRTLTLSFVFIYLSHSSVWVIISSPIVNPHCLIFPCLIYVYLSFLWLYRPPFSMTSSAHLTIQHNPSWTSHSPDLPRVRIRERENTAATSCYMSCAAG